MLSAFDEDTTGDRSRVWVDTLATESRQSPPPRVRAVLGGHDGSDNGYLERIVFAVGRAAVSQPIQLIGSKLAFDFDHRRFFDLQQDVSRLNEVADFGGIVSQ